MELEVFRDNQRINLREELHSTILCVVFVDPDVATCRRAVSLVLRLAAKVAALQIPASSAPFLLPIVVPATSTPVDNLLASVGDDGEINTADIARVMPNSATASTLRRACGIGLATAPPEIVCIDGATGMLLGTDLWRAIERNDVRADNYPQGWRTNSFVVQSWLQATKTAPAHHVRIHADALLRLHLYPGDTVLVRALPVIRNSPHSAVDADSGAPATAPGFTRGNPSAHLSSICAYVNAPIDEVFGDDGEADGGSTSGSDGFVSASEVNRDAILVSPSVLTDLFGSRQNDYVYSVAVEPYQDPPTATRVVLARSSTGGSLPVEVSVEDSRLLRAYFGVPSSRTAARAVAVAFVNAIMRAKWEEGDIDAAAAVTEDDITEMKLAADSDASASESPVGAVNSTLIEEYVTHAACRYVPLVAGQMVLVEPRSMTAGIQVRRHAVSHTSNMLSVPADGETHGVATAFRVLSTTPRFFAVIVGPNTELIVVDST